MSPVIVEPVKHFYGEYEGTIDAKSRVTIPADYRDAIIGRNPVEIAHGCADGSYAITRYGILHEGEVVFIFATPLIEIPSSVTPGDLESLLDFGKIDRFLGMGVTGENEIRFYALGDWGKIANQGQFMSKKEFKMNERGIIQLDEFLQSKFKPGDKVRFCGEWNYFSMKRKSS